MASSDARPRRGDSLQRRFFLLLAIFLVISMGLLGVVLFATQRDQMQQRLAQDTRRLEQNLVDKGNTFSSFLGRIAPQGLLTHDYLLLEDYVEELSADPDIVYAVIFAASGEPVTHYLNPGDPYFLGSMVDPAYFADLLGEARADHTLMKFSRDIYYEGTRLGQVEIGLTRAKIHLRAEELETNLRRVMWKTVLITGGLLLASLVVLVVLIEWVFRRLVVRPLHSLSESMASLQAGNLDTRAVVLRGDEIGFLVQRFNRMADDLQAQLCETEQHALAVQQTRDFLASILDHSADMIITTTTDGTIVQFNNAAEQILGFCHDELVGQNADLVYPDTGERERLYAAVYSGQPVRGTEKQLRRKDGSLVDVELTLSALRGDQGDLFGTVCIGRDVTHARALRRELLQAEKMASIGQVAAWIAHQIRNYLGRLLLDARSLLPAKEDPEARRNAHDDLGRAITEMERLVSDLLDYSRSMKLNRTIMRLNTTLDGLLNSFAAELESAGIRVERDFDSGLPQACLDVFKMEQAFTNVLRNAIDVMPDGGTLRVRTRSVADTDQVSVSIEDSGSGIAAEDQVRVFRPFYTSKPGGTGLGLAMAQRIVEAHGGSLRVHGRPGAGATFEFVLPVVEAAMQAVGA
jgi:PAS domain S-box-containing protein